MSSTALQYTQNGDYLIPNIELNQPQTPLGKYGRMRKTYLKENRPVLYNHLLLSGTLYPHLAEIDQAAKDRLDRQMEELLKQNPAPDKAVQQMAWVQENRPVLYNHLLLSGTLYPHLAEIDQAAKDRLDRQMEELLKQNPAPDKAVQQMAWVQHMNALKMQAEEAILNELIYS